MVREPPLFDSVLMSRKQNRYGQGPPAIVPLPLLKVQVVVLQLAWLADNENVFVPTAAAVETPVVALKPGGVPDVIVPAL